MMHGATNPEGEAPTTTKPATDTDAGTIERGRRDKPVRVGGGGGGIECGAAHKTGARGDKQDWWGLQTILSAFASTACVIAKANTHFLWLLSLYPPSLSSQRPISSSPPPSPHLLNATPPAWA